MITFDVTFDGTRPQVNVNIPLDDYLLDEEQVAAAQETIEGIKNLCWQMREGILFINDKEARSGTLNGIIETYRTLYLLKLLEDVLTRVKPLNDALIEEITQKVEPLIRSAKERLEYQNAFEMYE